MLMIAPNPDAAYEICTAFAPNCKYLSRLDYSSSFHINEDYEKENETDSNKDDFYLSHNSTTEHPVRINKLEKYYQKL